MDTTLAQMNLWAERMVSNAWPLLWQSSVLIALLMVLDLVLRKQLRASVRYAFWLVLLLKLVLPPTLALPSGIGWWVRQRSSVPLTVEPSPSSIVVRHGATMPTRDQLEAAPKNGFGSQMFLTRTAWLVLFSGSVSLGLFAWMLIRWRQVVVEAQPELEVPKWLVELFSESRHSISLRGHVRMRIVDRAISPAVCGLFRPTVLVPRALLERLSAEQMRSILLHELIHLKRGDVWVNCAQALLQIVYWWHPFLWLANARIRRVREEAVDDAVMAALQGEADAYAPTLVEVAKLAVSRPITALGLVGILESPGPLRQRIERLLEYRPPRQVGLTLVSVLCVLGFAAMALPMGPKPGQDATQVEEANSVGTSTNHTFHITQLTREAKTLYEAGNFTEAEIKLLHLLKESPKNESAHYYLNLIRDAEHQRLERILKQASQPEDEATNLPPVVSLYTRSFKVDPNTLAENLQHIEGLTSNTNLDVLQLKKFFESCGVEFTPPKTLYYKDREGVLLVRGTMTDLELIERAINELDSAPPQINVKVKFVELPVKLSKLFWDGLTNSATGVAILTEPQARVALKTLETEGGVRVINQASVTTLSGRQAQIQMAEEISVLVPTNSPSSSSYSLPSTFVTNQVPIGSVVDIYPVVGTNGYSIQLTVSASSSEFLGYDDPGQFEVQADSKGSIKANHAVLPLPHFRTLQIPTQLAILWDGQTLVLGRAEQIDTRQIPVFGGDRPVLGRLFRSEPKDKDFIVFLTTTIIDPAGNRVHADDERPGPDPKSR